MFSESFPDASLPTSAWRWVEAAQFTLAERGAHHGLSVVDLLICATAAHHELTVLHDDADFETGARFVDGVRAERVDD